MAMMELRAVVYGFGGLQLGTFGRRSDQSRSLCSGRRCSDNVQA